MSQDQVGRFSFSILTDQIKFFFQSGKWQKKFPYLSRLRRKPVHEELQRRTDFFVILNGTRPHIVNSRRLS